MELKITTLDGKEAGSVDAAGRDFRARAAHRPHSALRRLAARQAPRRHPQGQEPGRDQPHRQEDVPAEGHRRARHGSARVNLFRGGGRSFGPLVRSHAIGLPKKVRALALRHALSAKAKDGGIIVLDKRERRGAQDQGPARRSSSSSASTNALIIDGAEVDDNFRTAARNIPNIDVLPVAGHQRLRHSAAAASWC